MPNGPRRSPIQVLTGFNIAWLQWSDENTTITCSMWYGRWRLVHSILLLKSSCQNIIIGKTLQCYWLIQFLNGMRNIKCKNALDFISLKSKILYNYKHTCQFSRVFSFGFSPSDASTRNALLRQTFVPIIANVWSGNVNKT